MARHYRKDNRGHHKRDCAHVIDVVVAMGMHMRMIMTTMMVMIITMWIILVFRAAGTVGDTGEIHPRLRKLAVAIRASSLQVEGRLTICNATAPSERCGEQEMANWFDTALVFAGLADAFWKHIASFGARVLAMHSVKSRTLTTTFDSDLNLQPTLKLKYQVVVAWALADGDATSRSLTMLRHLVFTVTVAFDHIDGISAVAVSAKPPMRFLRLLLHIVQLAIGEVFT